MSITPHPHIYITTDDSLNLRTVAGVRRDMQSGRSAALWDRTRRFAEQTVHEPPIIPTTREIEGRGPGQAEHANRDYHVVAAAAQRIECAALSALLTEESRYVDGAMRQIECLYDDSDSGWPLWKDQAHHWVTADLRHGQLVRAIGVSYDWLHPLLSEAQRRTILGGLKRRGFDLYWRSVEEGAGWVNGHNNWMTVINGGHGIAAMAVGNDHYDRADELVAFTLERMRGYSNIYGPEGEFNESVGYAGANRCPIEYFHALHYHTRGEDVELMRPVYADALRWYLQFTVPPGLLFAQGDTHADAPPQATTFAPMAQLLRDGVFQWYFLNYNQPSDRDNPQQELLWFDPTLEPISPEGVLPRGRAFRAHSACIVSRSTWDPDTTPSVVCSKAGHGSEIHGQHDAGQVTIDGHARRLIVDLGAPDYPADYFGEHRYDYYPASVFGHNVLAFGGRETERGKDARARITHAEFDDQRGGTWSLDLTARHNGVRYVKRHVAHLLPGIVAVLDDAGLQRAEMISLRWHTFDRCEPSATGAFNVINDGVTLAAQIARLDGGAAPTFARREHKYRPPYNRNRLGDPLNQKRESYIEATLTDRACRLLTLFAVFGPGESPDTWRPTEGGWTIRSAVGGVTVRVGDATMTAERQDASCILRLA